MNDSNLILLAKINEKINLLTDTIRCNEPDIYEKLGEMTVTIPNESHPKIDLSTQMDYFLSLQLLINHYQKAKKCNQ